MTKSLFASKTFWWNALMLAVNLGGILPPKYGVPIATIGNVGIRMLTSQPVTVLPQ